MITFVAVSKAIGLSRRTLVLAKLLNALYAVRKELLVLRLLSGTGKIRRFRSKEATMKPFEMITAKYLDDEAHKLHGGLISRIDRALDQNTRSLEVFPPI